ncbi:MAG TPA: ribulose-phosphate 3-epimerase [Candidatus Nanoarchaeia archaeon]|nr:ribulose-phosphate 3-epimerase [Candidatus Nanoarchaeia archaeon]
MEKTIVPSIIADSQRELNKRVIKVKDCSNWLQLDIMDGNFVKNKSLMFDFRLPKTKCKYEAHLMIKDPELWTKKNWKKISAIIFHIEACKNKEEVKYLIELIKNKKRKVGIALNPKTNIMKIKPFLTKIDMVLIMGVYPGKYGAEFLPFTLNKIAELRKLSPVIKIEIDGGISPKTISNASRAGADRFVSGSFLQESKNPSEAIKQLERIVR